jgi:hypothetical protein
MDDLEVQFRSYAHRVRRKIRQGKFRNYEDQMQATDILSVLEMIVQEGFKDPERTSKTGRALKDYPELQHLVQQLEKTLDELDDLTR